MMHILDRGLIHFFASGGITLAALFVVRFLQRRYRWAWFSSELRPQLIFVAVSVFAGAALREAFDVASGQSVGKAIADYVSWFAGCAASVWAIWRVSKL